MSTIEIARNALRSRVVRELIGERTIDIFSSITQPEQGEDGLVNRLFGLASRLGGFLLSLVRSAVGWLISNLRDIIIEAVFEIVNFDWNQTDLAIEAQIQANNEAIAEAAGELVGSGAVWLTGIAVSSALAIKFPVLGAKVALDLAEEAGDELRGQVRQILTIVRNTLTRSFILGGFLTLRRLRLFGLAPVTQQREPWTIAEAVENRIEAIDDPILRSFAEGFAEGASEALIEMGYVISYSIEDYYRLQKTANFDADGKERAVKIFPNSQNENEFLVLYGPQHQLQQNVQNTLMTSRLVHNRDVGQIVGQPAEDWVRAKIQRRKLTIVFKSVAAPPWVNLEERIREATYTIPDAKVGLTWREIKAASRHYTWGKFRATAALDNGRQMAVHGATASDAENKLRELMALSTAEILTLSVTEEKDRHPELRKRATEMYPAYATLLIRRPVTDTTGRTDLSGQNYREEHQRIELWTDEEPPGMEPLL